ncbi:Baculoviral IAP repeat-containing protein 7-A, partial [Armadillidium vulgare]
AEGLFYSRNEDRCTCVFCWEIYDGWKEGCSVKEKHYKKSPDCFKFVMKHKADEFWKGPKKFYRDPYGKDTCGGGFKADKFIDNCKKDRIIIIKKIYNNSQKSNVHLDDFENAGIYRHSDVQAYPEYANKNDRLTTFDKWPENVLTHQSPEDLAEAGFLYTGIADFVVCFSCGQMIGIFEKDDIAWIEHAKFSPYCRYLLYKKNPSFKTNIFKQKKSQIFYFQWINTTKTKKTQDKNITDEKVVEKKEDATTRQCGGEDDREKKIIKSIKENSEMEEKNYSLLRDRHQYDNKKLTNSTTTTNIDDENIVKEKEETKRQINDVEEGGEKKKICIIDKCRECLDKPSEIVYLPCAHMILCVSCTLSLKNCPSCKEKIKYAFRPIL